MKKEFEGIAIEKSVSRGDKRRASAARAIAAYNALSPLEQIKQDILSINGLIKGDRKSLSSQLFFEKLYSIKSTAEQVGNQFIFDVCNSIDKYMSASEKQAYCVARFAAENNIKF